MTVSTESRQAAEQKGQTVDVDFYFDPGCPWAWRTSLWMREVEKVRPVKVHWKFLSLELINRARGGEVKDGHLAVRLPFKVMALARREGGEAAVDRLYLALGRARHERKENLGDRDVILAALDEAGLDRGLLGRAENDPSIAEELEREHEQIAKLGGFGVPTLLVGDCDPMFGPVINPAPKGEEAGVMWDHTLYFIRQPGFFELKREIRR